MKITIHLLLLVINCSLSFGQTCEKYERKLFHMLPNEFPDEINCTDTFGKKEGWWIIYEVEFNAIENAELDKGDYVRYYIYGMYNNNRKTGDWITVQNVHSIYQSRIVNYYYHNDTVLIKSRFAESGWNESTVYYNTDSSVIKSQTFIHSDDFPICIDCDKNLSIDKQCVITYRNEVVKYFPIDKFEMEFEKAFHYARERKPE